MFSNLIIEHRPEAESAVLDLIKSLNIQRFDASVVCGDGSFISVGGDDLKQLYNAVEWALEKDQEKNKSKIP